MNCGSKRISYWICVTRVERGGKKKGDEIHACSKFQIQGTKVRKILSVGNIACKFIEIAR